MQGHLNQTLLVDQSEHLLQQHLFEPLPNPSLPSSDSQVLQWLFNFTELKVPVLALYYQQMLSQGSSQHLVPEVDVASAVVTFTELLQASPDLPFNSEQDTSLYVCRFVRRVWRTLAKYSPTRLQYSLVVNKASQLSSVSSDAIARKLRPDTMLIAESCTLMLGEDKHTDLAAAFADLERKRVDLSGMYYGPLKFMLGYAAGGTVLQWCFLPCHADQVGILCCSGETCVAIYVSADHPVLPLSLTSVFQGIHCHCVLQPVQVVGPRLDFCNDKDRSSFLLSLVQAYRLLSVMSAAVPPLPGRWPLYSQIERENSMYVLATPTLLQYATDCAQQSTAQLSASKDLHAACCSNDFVMT